MGGDLLEQLEAKNVLTHLRPAFSRDQAEKVYIQDRIRQEAKGIYDALVTNKGYAYLCGQAGDREQDVVDAWTDAIRIGGNITAEEAAAEWAKIDGEGRYSRELY